MLASIQDYIHFWQLPLLLLLAVGWLWGGGSLLLKSLKKNNYPKRIKLGNCVLYMMLAGAVSVIAAAVFFMVFKTLGGFSMMIVGGFISLIIMITVIFLVIYAMLELPLKKSVLVSSIPVSAVICLLLLVVMASLIPARIARKADLKRGYCQRNLSMLHDRLANYQIQFGKPSDSLKTLIEKDWALPKDLICPGNEDISIGYFYYPQRTIGRNEVSRKILACDWKENHPRGRNVLYINGNIEWLNEKELGEVFALDENKMFQQALMAAEKK